MVLRRHVLMSESSRLTQLLHFVAVHIDIVIFALDCLIFGVFTAKFLWLYQI
jgi:hypothetical protein